jgi:hypothetical protein
MLLLAWAAGGGAIFGILFTTLGPFAPMRFISAHSDGKAKPSRAQHGIAASLAGDLGRSTADGRDGEDAVRLRAKDVVSVLQIVPPPTSPEFAGSSGQPMTAGPFHAQPHRERKSELLACDTGQSGLDRDDQRDGVLLRGPARVE